MRKKYNRILIALLAITLFSCADLEENPMGLYAPESFFKTEKDVQTMIDGSYGFFASEYLFGRTVMLSLDLSSDMADIGDVSTAAKRIQINNFSLDATNAMTADMWYYFYQVISNTNTVIDGVGKITATEDRKNALLAEARTIRALCYYYLVQLFGDVPLLVEMVSSPDQVSNIPRSPQTEVWKQIIADAQFGAQHLPAKRTTGNTSHPTIAAAKALLASSYLTTGDWVNAAKYAEEVIANESAYGLTLISDYQQVFNALATNTENIWAVDFISQIKSVPFQTDYYPATTGIRGSDDGGWSVIVASSTKLYDSFDNKDYRKGVIFQTGQYHKGVWKDWTKFVWPRIHYAKWRRFAGGVDIQGQWSDYNYPFFRYAEVLLIAAEALNEANGPSAKAYEYINRVRQRARFNGTIVTDFPANLPAGLSKDDFRKAVREERRVELAFEWKRWFDMKRWDDGDITKYFNKADSYENQPKVQKFHKFYPVPQTERDLNPNLTQNEGY